ncbi:hypothetical protein CcaverHIS002_0208420 [Cutaneotrichosporon cavernicola]|uniref:Afadin and alpha-actinin-binding-domain-containing protein n=1 Tax=Cutaneotrichosporon cavernicola TaxID=279322 RepID=A0AA48L065_9TREE|nr:uncharacterized protein CcaverHIS019_0208430 [Cutaneotrichosporon cavernicola]BEI81682.1 hypothetical protein CcaverHIS002_0208420 [Cutaneotrichosporon cavernicola]BEI89481.1 hypothetical protein CcaverHIS019_0208430 [Cutaneotrichosporon cavernicola]BEI97254.1 hypothetical protein CcaverHIS631_0208430 [Cutaneotrichosporon cavernicola]BEJ05028.1 hypothetical protein CcaverHIS641_0208450 [Cutaneotrichosporon cavernicola]
MPDDDKKTRHVSSLNAKLLAHGYANRPLKLDRLSDSEQVHVANVITELLGSSVANLSQIEELNGRLRSTEYERDRLYKSSERFETRCARLESEISASKARESSIARNLAEEEERCRSLRDETARARKAIEGIRLAAAQEAKRSQLKTDKLRDHLSKPPPTFELLNPVARGASSPAPGALPLLEAGLRDLSDLRTSLQEEAEAFRHVCVSTANGLNEALAASQGRESRVVLPTEFFDRGWTSHPAIADAKLRALVGDVRANLTSPVIQVAEDETELAERARAERERLKAEADLRDRVKDLEVEIAIVRGREEEARRVADEVAKLSVHATVPSTTDFEDARLREELVRQKRVLDAERHQLRDEGVRLHEERMVLEAERAQVAEARAAEARAKEERAAAEAEEAATALAALELDTKPRSGTISASSSSSSLAGKASSANHTLHPNPIHLTTKPATCPTLPAAPVTPRKHAPARPSPLSPHAAGALKKQAVVSPKKPKMHMKKRPSLARAVMDRQHRRSAEIASPRKVSVGGKRSVSFGSSSDHSGVLGEGGKRGNASGEIKRANASGETKRKSSSLTAGTAASLARSAKKPQGALRSQPTKVGAWR